MLTALRECRHNLLPMLGNLMGNLRLTVQQQNQREQQQLPQASSDGSVQGLRQGQQLDGAYIGQAAHMQTPGMVPVNIAPIPMPFDYM